MLFNSHEFIFVFLPIVLLGFFALGSVALHRVQLIWLVASSLCFYAWWDARYVSLIVSSIVANYALGALLATLRDRGRPHQATAVFVLGIGFNLALIGFFKYAGFLTETASALLGASWSVGAIVLPIGISFFTLQQIAYLTDIRRGERFEGNLGRYALFVLFFPHLIAGPIVQPRVLLPQLADRATFRPLGANIAVGLTVFSIGLFKKVVIADRFGAVADPIFAAAERGDELDSVQACSAALAYTFQLYFDFSGYSDMAIGLARLFGVRMPINFASPYKATSIIDLWRRWHITLSWFLRDYLYIPLGGNWRGPTRRYVNLMVTMLLGGLWHGAGWGYVIWGGLHGGCLVINHLWRKARPRPINRLWSRAVARAVTLFCVVVAWVFFRAESFGGAMNILRGTMNLPSEWALALGTTSQTLQSLGIRFGAPTLTRQDLFAVGIAAVTIAFVWTAPNTQQLMARVGGIDVDRRDPDGAGAGRLAKLRWRPSPLWGVLVGAAFGVSVLHLSRVSPFLYFQF